MVAGFFDRSPFSDEILERHKDMPGFMGRSAMAARYASERNTWPRHWFAELTRADQAEEAWRRAVLLGKIVDGRIDLWEKELESTGTPYKLFSPSIQRSFEMRAKEWRDKRKKTLFGDDALPESSCRRSHWFRRGHERSHEGCWWETAPAGDQLPSRHSVSIGWILASRSAVHGE